MAAFLAGVDALADVRVEAGPAYVGHTAGAAVRHTDGHDVLTAADIPGGQIHDLGDVVRNADGLEPVVAGADGDVAQAELRSGDTALRAEVQHAGEHLVHRAVPACGEEPAVPVAGCLQRQLPGV